MPRKLRSKLVFCNVPSKNSEQTQRFYGHLLGIEEFVQGLNQQVNSVYAPISESGVTLNITQRFDDQERLTCYFAVDNLDEMVAKLQELGGRVVAEARPVVASGPDQAVAHWEADLKARRLSAKPEVGRMTVILDPDGNHVGLIELHGSAERYFAVGRYKKALRPDQEREIDNAERIRKNWPNRT